MAQLDSRETTRGAGRAVFAPRPGSLLPTATLGSDPGLEVPIGANSSKGSRQMNTRTHLYPVSVCHLAVIIFTPPSETARLCSPFAPKAAFSGTFLWVHFLPFPGSWEQSRRWTEMQEGPRGSSLSEPSGWLRRRRQVISLPYPHLQADLPPLLRNGDSAFPYRKCQPAGRLLALERFTQCNHRRGEGEKARLCSAGWCFQKIHVALFMEIL